MSPGARCANCRRLVPIGDKQTKTGVFKSARKKFCTTTCQEAWQKMPVCGRCLEPINGPRYPNTRYHEKCTIGCRYCGRQVAPRKYLNRVSQKGLPVRDDYCSEKCLNAAWRDNDGKNIPFPQCEYAICVEGEVTPKNYNDPEKPTILRDPPKMHPRCRILWQEDIREDAADNPDEYNFGLEQAAAELGAKIRQKHRWLVDAHYSYFSPETIKLSGLPIPNNRQPWPRGAILSFDNLTYTWEKYFERTDHKKLTPFDYIPECQGTCTECYDSYPVIHNVDWYLGREDGW